MPGIGAKCLQLLSSITIKNVTKSVILQNIGSEMLFVYAVI